MLLLQSIDDAHLRLGVLSYLFGSQLYSRL